MKMSFSPVKQLALDHGSRVFQPKSLRDGMAARTLEELDCEIIAVVAYGKILPKEVLDIPPLGCINIHGSLLPKYRGAAPIQHAVLNGETETGVTSMYMAEEMDAGDIIYKRKVTVGEDETASELYDRLSDVGAGLLSETIDAISRGVAERLPQNHDEATFAPLLTKELAPIEWTEPAWKIKCKVRGLLPWPVATMEAGGKVFKVFSVDVAEGKTGSAPGEIVAAGSNGLEISCADGTVIIKELQAPGGRRMAAAEYLRGNPL
jgi:methionyl-tRNA formyltransferase